MGKIYRIGAQAWQKLDAGETVYLGPGVAVAYDERFLKLKRAIAAAWQRGDSAEASALAQEVLGHPGAAIINTGGQDVPNQGSMAVDIGNKNSR